MNKLKQLTVFLMCLCAFLPFSSIWLLASCLDKPIDNSVYLEDKSVTEAFDRGYVTGAECGQLMLVNQCMELLEKVSE